MEAKSVLRGLWTIVHVYSMFQNKGSPVLVELIPVMDQVESSCARVAEHKEDEGLKCTTTQEQNCCDEWTLVVKKRHVKSGSTS